MGSSTRLRQSSTGETGLHLGGGGWMCVCVWGGGGGRGKLDQRLALHESSGWHAQHGYDKAALVRQEGALM